MDKIESNEVIKANEKERVHLFSDTLKNLFSYKSTQEEKDSGLSCSEKCDTNISGIFQSGRKLCPCIINHKMFDAITV